jgi:hypothetical protein
MAGDDLQVHIDEQITLDPGDTEIIHGEKDGEPWVVKVIANECPSSGGKGNETPSGTPGGLKDDPAIGARVIVDRLLGTLTEARGGMLHLTGDRGSIMIEPEAVMPPLGREQAQVPAWVCSTRLEETPDPASNSFGVRLDPRLSVSPGAQALLVILPGQSPE